MGYSGYSLVGYPEWFGYSLVGYSGYSLVG